MNDPQFQLASMLLDGFIERDKQGRLRRKYLELGSGMEQEARRALARLLRTNQLNMQLREELASLFDPDQDSPGWQQRGIKITNRRRGRSLDHIAATEILQHIADVVRSGLSKNKAFVSAAEKYSISEEMAKRIWQRYYRSFGKELWDVV